MMPALENTNGITLEIIGGRRTQEPTHLELNKKLIADVANVRKISAVTICADDTNYYDRGVHPFASLCEQ